VHDDRGVAPGGAPNDLGEPLDPMDPQDPRNHRDYRDFQDPPPAPRH
jgi:hypothetical protein